jgi:hypothetical protein
MRGCWKGDRISRRERNADEFEIGLIIPINRNLLYKEMP